MANFLQVGDIIKIEKGMRIYAKLPSKYVYSNSCFNSEIAKTTITVGEVLVKKAVSKETLCDTIFDKIRYNIPVNREKVSEFIDSLCLNYDEETFDTSLLAGEYEVISTEYDGGSHDGLYPNGWHVHCKKIDDGTKVDFYQSGAFTAVIPEIKSIKR